MRIEGNGVRTGIRCLATSRESRAIERALTADGREPRADAGESPCALEGIAIPHEGIVVPRDHRYNRLIGLENIVLGNHESPRGNRDSLEGNRDAPLQATRAEG